MTMVEGLLLLVILLLAGILGLLLFRSPDRSLLNIESRIQELGNSQERTDKIFSEELAQSRRESAENARQAREELNTSLKGVSDSLQGRMAEMAGLQQARLGSFSEQLSKLTQTNEHRLDMMRETIEKKLESLQGDTAKKLEEMRATVDEKLHSTLEKRLGESFKLVSERLEQVHKGLGSIQSLASDVGDLRKVMANVKSRGTWGEFQLGSLLEQLLTPDQYEQNVCTKKGSRESVEFAIKLPGRGDADNKTVWLPIDAKFPQEDYQRLLDAAEQGDKEMLAKAGNELETRVKQEAKKIRDKYLNPPETTDFAIMFLPTESLYAEVARRPGLLETLQNDCRVTIMGPTNVGAFLNSLQMGFRTLAVEKRSSEVWQLLGAVKTEFGKFGDLLQKTKTKLEETTSTIEGALDKSRKIEQKLGKIQELPEQDARALLSETESPGTPDS